MSNEFDNKIKDLNNESVHSLGQCETQESLENWRVDFLGRRGQIALLLREIPKLDPTEADNINPTTVLQKVSQP